MNKFKIYFFIFFISFFCRAESHVPSFHSDAHNCTKCHLKNGDAKLVLLTGDSILIKQVPELCGQCHGIMKRDWERGSHGKKIKSWTNSGEKLICTDCHAHHNPKFPSFKAQPPQKRPKFSIPKGHQDE